MPSSWRGLEFDVSLDGGEKAEHDLEEIADRMRDFRRAAGLLFSILEAGEQRHFSSLRGRYVLTGATRDSLTSRSANGAIREAHAGELTFGTSIDYAQYLRRKKKSAVLVLKPKEKKRASSELLDFIVGGHA